ncbi:hypothetical protein N7G274_001758 [Stereocaulon virgatum]|uniref:Zn(2)-C6 fungal-type domain-containing protein n=1 Tax=Stereocaulon virgatum TaxID=373712 RepID=A0ABR4ANB2_9LECA
MPRPNAQSPSEDSMEGHEARRRVVKACQRCRLKKCKCDGASPCSRCKSDDAICAYGKHKKSDKIVFRKGYVQMLERQHTQLIAGLQELYRRIQAGESFPALELGHHGQPFTHKILESLGALQGDDWEDNNGSIFDTELSWRNFDLPQSGTQDYASMYGDSHSASPATQTTFSPTSNTQTTFPHSTIMAKRRSKFESNNSMATNQTLSVPPLLNTNNPTYHPGNFTSSSSFQIPPHLNTFNNDNGFTNDNGDNGYGHIDWMNLGVDDLFGNPQLPPLQVAT